MFSWVPMPGQNEFLKAKSPVKALACGRRWGKTEVASREVFLSALENKSLRQIILAPSYDQARLIFDRVTRMFEQESDIKFELSHNPYPKILLRPGSISARSAVRDGIYLRGHGADRVVIDEAAYVPESVINEVVMPMLAESKGQLVMISTPNGKNHFYRTYQRGFEPNSGVWSRSGRTAEHDLVPRAFLESQRQLLTDEQYRIEYNAEFLENSRKVFQSDWVERAVLLRKDEQLLSQPISIGIDWARYHDYTAVVAAQGTQDCARVIWSEHFNQMAWAEQIARAADICRNHRPMRVICDKTSVGDPLLEQLQQAVPHIPIEGLTFTNETKRSLIDRLVIMLQQDRLQLKDDLELLREFQHFTADTAPSGTVKLNAESGYHDDLIIALCLALSGLPETANLPRIGMSSKKITNYE